MLLEVKGGRLIPIRSRGVAQSCPLIYFSITNKDGVFLFLPLDHELWKYRDSQNSIIFERKINWHFELQFYQYFERGVLQNLLSGGFMISNFNKLPLKTSSRARFFSVFEQLRAI